MESGSAAFGCAKLVSLDVATWPFMTLTLKVELLAPFSDELGGNMATEEPVFVGWSPVF